MSGIIRVTAAVAEDLVHCAAKTANEIKKTYKECRIEKKPPGFLDSIGEDEFEVVPSCKEDVAESINKLQSAYDHLKETKKRITKIENEMCENAETIKKLEGEKKQLCEEVSQSLVKTSKSIQTNERELKKEVELSTEQLKYLQIAIDEKNKLIDKLNSAQEAIEKNYQKQKASYDEQSLELKKMIDFCEIIKKDLSIN